MSKQERMQPDQLSAAVENLRKLEDQEVASSGSKLVAEVVNLGPNQLSGAVENLQELEAQGAAMFGRQVADTPVRRRKYKDVDYWREGLAKLLARSAAVVSVDKPLVVRK